MAKKTLAELDEKYRDKKLEEKSQDDKEEIKEPEPKKKLKIEESKSSINVVTPAVIILIFNKQGNSGIRKKCT